MTIGELCVALERDEIEIHLQSEVWLEDGRHFGYEAQPRWNHPRRGVIDGARLLSEADADGVGLDLARCLVERACEELERRDAERPDACVSVALPALDDPRLLDIVGDALARSEALPSRLCIEVPARHPIDALEASRDTWLALKSSGVRFALAGCGSGAGSGADIDALPLGPLAVFPFDYVRLDASLIRAVSSSARARRVVATIARTASELEAIALADGIVTNTEAIAAYRLGCRVAQGPRFGSPLPPLLGARNRAGSPAAVPPRVASQPV